MSDSPKHGVRQALDFVVEGNRPALALVGLLSFGGGLLEAAFLVSVTRLAFGISEQASSIQMAPGLDTSPALSILLLALVLLVRVAFALLATWRSSALSAAVVGRVRRRLSRAFLHSSWAFQSEQRSGSLQELLTRLANEAAELIRSCSMLTVALMNLLAMLTIAIVVEPAGALVLVATVGLLGYLIRPLRKLIWKRSNENNAVSMEFATAMNETSQLGLELHVFNVHDEAQARLERIIDDAEQNYRRRAWAGGIVAPIYSGLAYTALLGALALVTLIRAVDLVSIGAVMLVLLRSLTYGQAVQNSLSSVSTFAPSALRLRQELERFSDEERRDSGERLPGVKTIELEDVSFSYHEDEPVLRSISCAIGEREVIGIVGPSGAGKSTLVQLVLGVRSPSDGRILFDGVSIDRFAREDLARRVTFVPQDPNLIAGSVADNIRFFRSGVSDDDVIHAARMAHVHDDIARMPDAYDSHVGEGGGHLSGGQRQRVCIARALVERPDVLILDEPTSALDMRSENLIRSTLAELRQTATIIVIAHRLSTLEICDRIMVIQDGCLRGFDSPARLELESPFYQEALRLSGMR